MDHREDPDRNTDITPDRPDDAADAADDAPQSVGAWLTANAPYFVVIAAVFWFLHYHLGFEWLAIVIGLLGLGFIIFIHELGHFLVAKWCDVHVQTFSIGFGPALPGCKFRRGETTYMIALLPLGGYVKMVGETPDDEHDDDPRSFRNKPVWQRMAIISAGVTMNLILGFALFVFVYMTLGEERPPAVVGHVEPGSAAWQEGVRPGDKIYQIGDAKQPYFDDLMIEVMTSDPGESLRFAFGRPGRQPTVTTIVPREAKNSSRPVIGIAPQQQLEMLPSWVAKSHELPVQYNSAAARAEPPFEFGDRIVGCSDPDGGGATGGGAPAVTPLPIDPDEPSQRSYFEFQRRLCRLAGRPVVVRVERGEPPQTVDITVPPAFHQTLGLRMRMGKVVAVRDGSPADGQVRRGDILERVEVRNADGKRTRYAIAPTGDDQPLDPLRLPHQLETWAASVPAGQPKKVVLTLLRANPPPDGEKAGNHQERQKVRREMVWQDGWRCDDDRPAQATAPLPLDGLGLAYEVECTVDEVAPGSPAASEGIKPGDVLKAYRFFSAGKKLADEPKPGKWADLEPNQFAFVFELLQEMEVPQVAFKVQHEGEEREVALTSRPDATWPLVSRGLLLRPDRRLVKADTLGQALAMGTRRTVSFINQIRLNLRTIIRNPKFARNFSGPLGIGRAAFETAGTDYSAFLSLMAIISVNLAVINFLPIPVLDGGHMVFLIYEAIFRKPAPERILSYSMIVGLVLLLSLMVFVTYLDLGGR